MCKGAYRCDSSEFSAIFFLFALPFLFPICSFWISLIIILPISKAIFSSPNVFDLVIRGRFEVELVKNSIFISPCRQYFGCLFLCFLLFFFVYSEVVFLNYGLPMITNNWYNISFCKSFLDHKCIIFLCACRNIKLDCAWH